MPKCGRRSAAAELERAEKRSRIALEQAQKQEQRSQTEQHKTQGTNTKDESGSSEVPENRNPKDE